MIGAVGAAFGVLVYALALASSYSHLRHYYKGYEAQGVRASWALALAVEVATFYMSFAYVVIHSGWAFWGSLIGAFVVFWGNLSSMYEARVERLQEPPAVRSAHAESPLSVEEDGPGGRVFRGQSAIAHQEVEALYEERVSEVRQAVRAMRLTQDIQREPAREPEPTLPVTMDAEPLRPTETTILSETDREVLRLAAAGPVGPSAIARALGIAKSSAGDRLRRLERMGLLVKGDSGYRLS